MNSGYLPSHPYVGRRFRGLGQDTLVDPTTGVSYTDPFGVAPMTPPSDSLPGVPSVSNTIYPFPTPGLTTTGYPSSTSGAGVPSSTGAGFNWGSLINTLTGAASRAYSQTLSTNLTQNLLSRGLYANPTTGQVSVLPANIGTAITSYLPLILLGAGGILLFSMVQKR